MNVAGIDPTAVREFARDVDVQFPRRWSPRAMTGERLDQRELERLLEAARWAPSCFNEQPWVFVYAHRDTPAWPGFLDALVEGNQVWARRAAVLLAVLSRSTFERNGEPSPTHSFDAGAAWMSLALQASRSNLVAHGMRGFDQAKARAALAVPELYAINAMVAVGHPGDVEALPEKLRARETPSPRKPLAEIAFEGRFPPDKT